MKLEVFATKLPPDLKKQLAKISELLGLRKNFIVEEAIREKLEDLLDAYDLREAQRQSSGFRSWSKVKKGIR